MKFFKKSSILPALALSRRFWPILFAGILSALAVSATAVSATAVSGKTTEPSEAPRTVDKVLKAKARGEIEIRTSAGRIRVVGEDRLTVHVVGSLGHAVDRFEIFEGGRYLRFIAHPPPAPPEGPLALDSELTWHVPAGSSIDLQTIEAAVEISGITGRVRIHNATGASSVQGRPRSIHAGSVTGDLMFDVVSPDVELKTVAGSVTVGGTIENLIAETVSTPLRVLADIGVEAQLHTVTGPVELKGSPAPTARLRAESSSGEVRFELDPELTGHFSLTSDQGELTNALGPGWSRSAGRLEAEWARGESPRQIQIHTLDGAIHLEARPPSP